MVLTRKHQLSIFSEINQDLTNHVRREQGHDIVTLRFGDYTNKFF